MESKNISVMKAGGKVGNDENDCLYINFNEENSQMIQPILKYVMMAIIVVKALICIISIGKPAVLNSVLYLECFYQFGHSLIPYEFYPVAPI